VRSFSSILAPALLPIALAGALVLPQAASAQAIAPIGPNAWEVLDQGLTGLDQAYLQQLDPGLWLDVRGTVWEALSAVRAARDAGAPDDICLAAQRTLVAINERQEILAPQMQGDDPGENGGLERIADDLLYVEGRLATTSLLLIEVLFELERDREGADVLSRALVQWPGDSRLHESARAWRFVLPAPEELVNQLNRRVQSLDSADTQVSGYALETIGMLHGAMGIKAYEAQDYAIAGLHFDASNQALHRSVSMPRMLADEEVLFQRADASVNAAMSFLGNAQKVWFDDRTERKLAVDSMYAAEESISNAMKLRPDHEPTLNAVLVIGEAWKDKADVNMVTNADLADSREYFRRMAERFDVATWWNNYAFWCRETGTAAQRAGDPERALALFENSHTAYERTIELEPDNSRYLNDTGLMLLDYLNRDLERAEELFHRSWKAGKAVCDNPFVEQAVFDENLSAYGDAILNLAKLALGRGEVERAKELNDELLGLSPERMDAKMLARQIDAAM